MADGVGVEYPLFVNALSKKWGANSLPKSYRTFKPAPHHNVCIKTLYISLGFLFFAAFRPAFGAPSPTAAFCLYGCPTGAPAGNTTIVHHILTLSNNPARRFADWVAYRVTPETIASGCKRLWKRDPALPASETLSPADYRGARRALHTDRGHAAPLASLCGTRYWREADYLSNITPQAATLNEGPWKFLEAAVRKLALADHGAVFVITGPLYEGSTAALPARPNVHIPSGYFKVIAIRRNGGLATAAFIMDQHTARDADFCATRVKVSDIEKRSGLGIFPELPTDNGQTTELPIPGCP